MPKKREMSPEISDHHSHMCSRFQQKQQRATQELLSQNQTDKPN
jgi:hypothetical protein